MQRACGKRDHNAVRKQVGVPGAQKVWGLWHELRQAGSPLAKWKISILRIATGRFIQQVC